MYLGLYISVCVCVTTINEKRGLEFGREQGVVYVGFGGKKGEGEIM